MKLLEQLTQTAGVPGREHRIRELILKETKDLFDEVRVDPMGSVIGVRKPRVAKNRKAPKKPVKVMLAAHMDQIGFLVSYIDENGFLRVTPVGGFDTRNLFARLCVICPDLKDPKKDLVGVMNPGGKPVHVASPEERKKVPEISDLTIDLGLPADEVKKKVTVGDVVVLKSPSQQIGNTFVAQCMDNRVACWIVIRALEKLKKHDCEIHCVFTVQEEVGLRGARTAAFSVMPDIGIAIDTTLCIDTPGGGGQHACTEQGKGAALTIKDSSSIGDLGVIEAFESTAKKKKIKCQRSILAGGGTDAGTIQAAGIGVRTFTLSCPTRYIHTVTEMVHLG